MKLEIFGFSQEIALAIRKSVGDKIYKLDVTDLLLLNVLADSMNRKDIIKFAIHDKMYFSISYANVISDLPILDIKKQALRDRLDKLCLLGLLEKQVIKNETGSWTAFRLGDLFENMKYTTTGGVCSQLHTGVYSTTHGCVAEYTPNNNYNINNNTNNTATINNDTIICKEEKEKSLKEKEKSELFEQCWVAYNRKGSKKKAKDYWHKLSNKEKDNVLQHIKVYVTTREKKFQKDFERYLRDKTFNDLIIQGDNVVYDPNNENDKSYHPITGGALNWNDYYKCYLYTAWYFEGQKIYDGYDDDKRPDGAQIVLNNGRGTLTWSKIQKKWIKK